jgi:transcriptional regulator with XRE-family HTH domain
MEFQRGARHTARMAHNPMLIPKDGPPRHYIREWRKMRGLTQEQLAERTTFTPGAISQLETGRTRYTQPILEELATALGVEPGDLISRHPLRDGRVVELFSRIPKDKQSLAIEMLSTFLKASA